MSSFNASPRRTPRRRERIRAITDNMTPCLLLVYLGEAKSSGLAGQGEVLPAGPAPPVMSSATIVLANEVTPSPPRDPSVSGNRETFAPDCGGVVGRAPGFFLPLPAEGGIEPRPPMIQRVGP